MSTIESLDDITTFVKVIEEGSFQGAGKVLGISKSLVSKRVTRLEEQLGVQLLNRSTRRLDLTEAGQNYFEKVKSIPLQIDAARESTLPLSDGMEGELKLVVPLGFGMSMMQALLPKYMADFPNVTIQMKSIQEPLTCMNENFDIIVSGKRPHERFPDSNLISKPLLDLPAGIYASREYLEKNGTPKHPDDIKNHQCICYIGGNNWPFLDKDGNTYEVHVQPYFRANNSPLLAQVVLADQGICYGFDYMFEPEDFASGKIVKIMGQHVLDVLLNCHLFYPNTDYLPAKTRVMIERMLETYRGERFKEKS